MYDFVRICKENPYRCHDSNRSQEASTTVGAEFATSSVLIEPLFEVEVVDAAIATVPMDVLPLPCDTKEKLTARLAASSFLEDSHVLKGGSGPRRVRHCDSMQHIIPSLGGAR